MLVSGSRSNNRIASLTLEGRGSVQRCCLELKHSEVCSDGARGSSSAQRSSGPPWSVHKDRRRCRGSTQEALHPAETGAATRVWVSTWRRQSEVSPVARSPARHRPAGCGAAADVRVPRLSSGGVWLPGRRLSVGLQAWRCTVCQPALPRLSSLLRGPAAGTGHHLKAGACRLVEVWPPCGVGRAADLPPPGRLGRRPGSAQRGGRARLWSQRPATARVQGRRRLLVRSSRLARLPVGDPGRRTLLTTPAARAGPYEKEVEVAVNAVRLACLLCQKVQAGCVPRRPGRPATQHVH